MSQERLADLERFRAEASLALAQLQRDFQTARTEADIERGKLLATLASQLERLIGQIEGMRSELSLRSEMQSRYDEMNETRFDLLRSELRRLDQVVQQQREERDSWHETTGLRELEEIQARARLVRSEAPAPRPRRISREAELVPVAPAPPPPPPESKKSVTPPLPPPTGHWGALVHVVKIIFADQAVAVRFVVALALLVMSVAALLVAVKSLTSVLD